VQTPQRDISIKSNEQGSETIAKPLDQSTPKTESLDTQAKSSIQTSQEKVPVPAGKARISALSSAKLRSHPNQFGKVIEELSPGTEVTVLENQGNWCKIKTAHNIGFVASDNLSSGGK
jgi:hypothetical protein